MVLRINTAGQQGSHSVARVVKNVLALLLLTGFCELENTGFAQMKFLKGNNSASTSSGTPQNRNTASNKTGPQAQGNRIFKRPEPQALPQGNRNDRLLDATNAPAAMREVSKTIPWNRLSNPAKEKVQAVLSGKPIYRRLPQQSAFCEPVMYDFLLDHPDVVVAMWEKLGVTQISLKEMGRPGLYQLKESVGSVGVIEVLYKTRNYCLVYSKGSYTGPLLPRPVEGEAILVLQSTFEQDEDGDPYVVSQLDAFVNVKNFGVDMFAKLFAPMLGKIADNNFEQTVAFIGNVSEAAQSNPEVIKRLALRLETIPKEVRDDFVRTAYQTAQASIDRSGDELESNPYGRGLVERQTVQAESRRQEFDQERIQYLQNLYRTQQLQKKQQEQREALTKNQSRPLTAPAPNLRHEVVETDDFLAKNRELRPETAQPAPITPTLRQPTILQVKPKSQTSVADKKDFVIGGMSPDDDLSGQLDFVEQAPRVQPKPVPTKIAPKTAQTPKEGTPLNLDLDLDLDLGLDVPTQETKREEKNPSEQPPLILDLGLETSEVRQTTTAAPATPPKTASNPAKGKAIFGAPSLSR